MPLVLPFVVPICYSDIFIYFCSILEMRDGIKRHVPERDYAAMYPYESMEELIEDGLVFAFGFTVCCSNLLLRYIYLLLLHLKDAADKNF